MSIEDLQADLSANIEDAKGLSALSSVGDVVAHLKNTLWPFLENLTGELVEMDDALDSMYHQSEDVLQFESGKQLMAVLSGAATLIGDLKQRASGDPKLLAAITEWEKAAKEAAQMLEEITLPEGAVPDEEDEDDDPDGDDEGDEGDEGDDDDADGKDAPAPDTKKEDARG